MQSEVRGSWKSLTSRSKLEFVELLKWAEVESELIEIQKWMKEL